MSQRKWFWYATVITENRLLNIYFNWSTVSSIIEIQLSTTNGIRGNVYERIFPCTNCIPVIPCWVTKSNASQKILFRFLDIK